MSLSYKVTQEENLRGDDGGVGGGGVVWYKGCSRSAEERGSTKSYRATDNEKTITFWSSYKRSNGNKKMTISRFYLHSENDTSDSLFLSTPPPPHVCLSSSSSILPLSFRGSKMVLLQRTGPPCGFHSPLIYACISIHVCVRCACVCVFLSVIILYSGPKGSMHCSLRKRM